MPRIARRDYNTSFFHVMVQGIRKEFVFNDKEDMECYLELIYIYMKKYKVKIISYCMMNNHMHLLVYVDKIESLSKFMKGINTKYAMHYNKRYKKDGYVFRNRYKSEPIFNVIHLNNCINYIHNNPVAAGICKTQGEFEYSSYNEYKTNKGKIIKTSRNIFPEIEILYKEQVEDIERKYSFIDYEEEKEYKDKQEVISKYIKENKIRKEEIKNNKEKLKEIIIKLREECKITHQEIAEEMGIERTRVTKIINRN